VEKVFHPSGIPLGCCLLRRRAPLAAHDELGLVLSGILLLRGGKSATLVFCRAVDLGVANQGNGCMRSIQFTLLPAPDLLKKDVECFRIAHYSGEEGFALTVSPNGMPGIVFQQNNGRSPIETIITPSGSNGSIPTLYIYGQTTEPGVMNHKKGPYTTVQVILKPHALHTLLGINASALTNGLVELHEFSAHSLPEQLLEANNEQEQIALLTSFLVAQLKQEKARDTLVEESLCLIHKNIASLHVKSLLEHLNISERQFERRFSQTVGVSPQLYIRMKRFNEAVRLMKTGQFEALTAVAHALDFYDQSHFIRDIKAFSGMTPKSLSHKADDFHHGQAGYFYISGSPSLPAEDRAEG
jgi:AraC-like DNA-binding protein